MKQMKLTSNNYKRINLLKVGMSQQFSDDSRVVPYTGLKLINQEDKILFDSCEVNTKLNVTGVTKGRGFSGVMKRWNFHGGPKTHGQSDRSRAPGSIGTQGQGRVIPGKKMPGRYGNDKHSIVTKYLGYDESLGLIKIKGCVPGSRNSKVTVYLPLDLLKKG
ncbi:50S ribosomal protein L3 [candidate division WWE3 bacterium CG_4_9_14_0_2_um_filter_35_11]|uniref:Large ribosomal subunit protein uL3 n=1 Tax=candidate division WWE3 bacterium CG_4_9_14_0_2_um_filter_35_11 TaxID=1975077 RepID=A0A2M8EL12_UNCKA|nr:MAG: 50S ribosomal protein L3 [candidate division WWE3 bacterium CG10_big_fil_rev_8_21_14_0_10_35_32]PJC23419.1 MAG: 50S ribosomal protein L3 [candidate division WWE3 bacterium CG_4_9_14_0_2_um_filter_35_11]